MWPRNTATTTGDSESIKRLEPAHEIMALFVLRKLILQTRMCSHPVGPDIWCLVGPFGYFHTSCVQTAKALARQCGSRLGLRLSPVWLSTIISLAGSNDVVPFYYVILGNVASNYSIKPRNRQVTVTHTPNSERNIHNLYELYSNVKGLKGGELIMSHVGVTDTKQGQNVDDSVQKYTNLLE